MKKKSVGRPRLSSSDQPLETRARMLEAAEELLSHRGYAAVSMDAVAKQAGVTKATIYHYFPDGKDGLILAVAHQVLQRHQEGVAQAIALKVAPREQLESIANWVFSGNGQIDRMLRDVGRFLPASHGAAIFQGFMNSLYLPIESVLKNGVACGDFRHHDTTFMTWTFLTLLGGFETYRDHVSPQELARRLNEIVLNGIAPDDSSIAPEVKTVAKTKRK